MPMFTRVSGVWKNVDQPAVRVSGVWKNVETGWVKVAGVWKKFYESYIAPSLSMSPTSVSGAGVGIGTQNVTTNAATATVSDGEPVYTYAWTHVSGDVLTVNSPTSNSTTFTKSLDLFDIVISVYRCTVTDGQSNTATADVNISMTNEP